MLSWKYFFVNFQFMKLLRNNQSIKI
jgi:hypothetical protein